MTRSANQRHSSPRGSLADQVLISDLVNSAACNLMKSYMLRSRFATAVPETLRRAMLGGLGLGWSPSPAELELRRRVRHARTDGGCVDSRWSRAIRSRAMGDGVPRAIAHGRLSEGDGRRAMAGGADRQFESHSRLDKPPRHAQHGRGKIRR